MKRILTLTLTVCLLATAAHAEIEGAWTAAIDEKRPDKFYVNFTTGKHNNMGTTMRIAEFTGLTRAQIDSQTMTMVEFQLPREAGTMALEGSFRRGKGAGQFTFTANRSYINAVQALGVKFDLERKHKRSDEESLFSLALHDVSTAFIKSMQAEGYKVSLEKYLTMRIFDITPEYIHEMRSLGFKNMDDDELVATKIHRVTPDYVRKMRAAGWNLTLDQLQASAIHGATPEFAAEMRKLGYTLDFDDLVAFRIHRVTPEFIDEIRKLGYDKVPADDLVAMRIHRVTPEFIREIQAAGYKKVPIDKLVSMRIHGIDAKYLKTVGDS
jgi:hypothetical protein